MKAYTEEQLKEIISTTYGFKKELVQNAELCGLWHVRFMVNDIKYYGWAGHSGSVDQLNVEGYRTPYFDQYDSPVTERFYNDFIKGKKIVLRHCTDKDSGEWEDVNIKFSSQEQAKRYISELDNPDGYFYDFVE